MSFIDKIKSTIDDAKKRALDTIELVDNTVFDKRMAICLECPNLLHTTMQCRKCGCLVKAKTKLKIASCPINKW
jgi:hypothetical protein